MTRPRIRGRKQINVHLIGLSVLMKIPERPAILLLHVVLQVASNFLTFLIFHCNYMSVKQTLLVIKTFAEHWVALSRTLDYIWPVVLISSAHLPLFESNNAWSPSPVAEKGLYSPHGCLLLCVGARQDAPYGRSWTQQMQGSEVMNRGLCGAP